MVISGAADQTVRIWDLATGIPVGNPFTGHHNKAQSLAFWTTGGNPRSKERRCVAAGSGNLVIVSKFITTVGGDWSCEEIANIELNGPVLALTWFDQWTFFAATELGIIAFNLLSRLDS